MLSSAPQCPCWTPWCAVGGLQSVLVLTWAQGSLPPGCCCLQLSAVLTCQHCVLSSEAQALGVKSEGGAAEGQGGGGHSDATVCAASRGGDVGSGRPPGREQRQVWGPGGPGRGSGKECT